MKVTISVELEISDDAAVILDAANVGGAAGTVRRYVADSLKSLPGFQSVSVESDESESESAREPVSQRPPYPNRPATLNAREARFADRAERSQTTSKPMGRPATLWDHKCSDGGPVRERGERSIESLVAAGKEVYRLDGNGAVAETFGSKKPVKKSAPAAAKGIRPPVVSKRRGQ